MGSIPKVNFLKMFRDIIENKNNKKSVPAVVGSENDTFRLVIAIVVNVLLLTKVVFNTNQNIFGKM